MTDRERDGGAGLSPIEEVIADAAAGKLFILVDDEDRENEGDLCVIGEWADASAINFMAKHGRGLICLALTRARTEALGLSLMERRNESRHQTAFTVSIEAREGVTTGISAGDRAHTVRTAINPQCDAKDIPRRAIFSRLSPVMVERLSEPVIPKLLLTSPAPLVRRIRQA